MASVAIAGANDNAARQTSELLAPLDPNQMLTTDEAAALLGLKPATLAKWREEGSEDLTFSKFGRAVRYRYADVIAFADRHRARSTVEARHRRAR